MKHPVHIRLPIVERLVEGACASKHAHHTLHFGHVPIIERLVKRRCASKHLFHINHVGHVPIVERLIEGACVIKHPFHIRHFGHVPLVERLVEGFCVWLDEQIKFTKEDLQLSHGEKTSRGKKKGGRQICDRIENQKYSRSSTYLNFDCLIR